MGQEDVEQLDLYAVAKSQEMLLSEIAKIVKPWGKVTLPKITIVNGMGINVQAEVNGNPEEIVITVERQSPHGPPEGSMLIAPNEAETLQPYGSF